VARVSEDGQVEVTHAVGRGSPGLHDGTFEEAELHHPEGMALAGDVLYIADKDNHAIRAAHLPSGTLRTVAGTGRLGYDRRGKGVGTSVSLNSPWDLLVHDGWLYIAMAGLHQLWRMNLSTGELDAFVGSGRENIDDGPNPRASLAQPSGLTTDGERLFFADSESSAVRAADFAPHGYTRTLVGVGLFEFGDRDGKAAHARLQHCLGVAHHHGRVYIADAYNNKVKMLDLSNMEVATLYGSGQHSELYEPGGLSVWAGDGGHQKAALYIADTNNHRVVRAVIGDEGKLVDATPINFTFTFSSG
jgi:hypothetical protein